MPVNVIEQESMKKLMAQLFNEDLPTSKSQDTTVIVEPSAPVPVKEEVIPEQSTPLHVDFPPYRHRDLAKPKPQDTFSFDTHMKAYEEMQRKGTRKLEIILSALGDEKARDYVKLYFASDSVKWSVKKFKLHLQSNIANWTELRQKYGDGGFANYSESIMTNELILRTLDELDNKLMEIDKLAT